MSEIKKGMQIIKEGLKKGLKGHKKGCDCKFCQNIKSKEEGEGEKEGDEGLTDAQKKLPEALRKAIAKKAKGKDEKKCGTYMKKEDADWWNSVNSMINSDPDQKNWDGGWSQVGEISSGIRDEERPV
jgi:hypothetical protein